MTKLQREIISRVTTIVLGMTLLFGSFKCFVVAEYLHDHPSHPEAPAIGRRYDGAMLPLIVAYGLLFAGGLAMLVGVLPTRMIERMLSTPKHILWENPRSDNPRGPWR